MSNMLNGLLNIWVCFLCLFCVTPCICAEEQKPALEISYEWITKSKPDGYLLIIVKNLTDYPIFIDSLTESYFEIHLESSDAVFKNYNIIKRKSSIERSKPNLAYIDKAQKDIESWNVRKFRIAYDSLTYYSSNRKNSMIRFNYCSVSAFKVNGLRAFKTREFSIKSANRNGMNREK